MGDVVKSQDQNKPQVDDENAFLAQLADQPRLEDFAYKGNLAEVARMLERNADPNTKDTNENGYEWTAINSAAAAGHKQVVELLLRNGANPSEPNIHENTALHSAAARGNIHVCRFLAEIDEDWWRSKDEFKHWKASLKGKDVEGKDDGDEDLFATGDSWKRGKFWVADSKFLEAQNQKKKTAKDLAHMLDHDHVTKYLEHRLEQWKMIEARKQGTNRPEK